MNDRRTGVVTNEVEPPRRDTRRGGVQMTIGRTCCERTDGLRTGPRPCEGANGRVTTQRDPAGVAQGRPGPALQTTKLHAARLRPDTVRRSRLTSLLVAERPSLTLLVAPPGFGKTSLLADWSDVDPRPFAWLTIDVQDNDQTVLWTYIGAALERVASDGRLSSRLVAAGPGGGPGRGRGPCAGSRRRGLRARPRRLPPARKRRLPRLPDALRGAGA